MVIKRKLVGYYLKKGRTLKAYVKFNKKTQKYGKTRYTGSNKKLKKGIRVYKKKSSVPKLKSKSKTKKVVKKNKFGFSAPFFEQLVPVAIRPQWSIPNYACQKYVR
tara:strand:- start:556 stop:873 length:318 start_codon:yes stop_codon:yes gene_type:complete